MGGGGEGGPRGGSLNLNYMYDQFGFENKYDLKMGNKRDWDRKKKKFRECQKPTLKFWH